MEIKEAVDFIRNSPPEIKDEDNKDFEKFSDANLAVLNAIYNGGYTLCKVDEAVEKMENGKYNGSFPDNPFYVINQCIKIIKEASNEI